MFLKYIAIIYIRIEIDLYFVCYTSADKKIPSWLTDLGWILKYLDAAGCKAFHFHYSVLLYQNMYLGI